MLKKDTKYVTQLDTCMWSTFLFSNIFLHDNGDKHIDVAHFLIKTVVSSLFLINSVIDSLENHRKG